MYLLCRFWNGSSSTVQMYSRCQCEDSPPLTCSPGAGSLPQRRMTRQTGNGWTTEVQSFPSTVPYSGMLEKLLRALFVGVFHFHWFCSKCIKTLSCYCLAWNFTGLIKKKSLPLLKDSSLKYENVVIFYSPMSFKLVWYSFFCETQKEVHTYFFFHSMNGYSKNSKTINIEASKKFPLWLLF